MHEFVTIEKQPEFPNVDLSERNVPMLKYYLHANHDHRTYADFLKKSMRPLYLTAHQALKLSGVKVIDQPTEYASFCDGFAAFEHISLLVNPWYKRNHFIVKNTESLLMADYIIPELQMARRRPAWMDMFPNVSQIITSDAVTRGETMQQLHSRAIGAQIASELQMTT